MEGTMPGAGQQEAYSDASLQDTLKRFNDAFNRFDANEVASFWSDDGTLLTPGGQFGRGRAGVTKAYADDCETILEGSTSKFTISGARKITGDCFFLDLDHELRNFRMPDGSTGLMKLHVVILARKRGDSWQWLDARPYAFMPSPQRVH